jgi:tRNA A-37 threonylcarbamoyl transferase component Bud32
MDHADNVDLNTVCIVMERCAMSLARVISEQSYVRGSLPELLRQSRGRFVHGDLKCNNVCVNEKGLLVFIDFGRGFMCDGLEDDLKVEGHLLDAVGLLQSIERHTKTVSDIALSDIKMYIKTIGCENIPNPNDMRSRRRALFRAVTEFRK